MAVELRFLSVVVPIDRINESSLPGGFRGILERRAEHLGKMCWHDEHLYCEVEFSPGLVQSLCQYWERHGIQSTETVDGVLCWKDLCVIDYYQGLTMPCEWIRVDQREHIAWHANHAKGATVRGDDTFPQNKAVFLPQEVLREAVIEVVDPEDTEVG